MRNHKTVAACAALLASAAYLTTLNAANSPLADAAMKGDAAQVRTLLGQKADVNAQQADGSTAIQWAAYRNDLAVADLLIAASADVKLANRNGVTPLRLAATNGSADMIGKLLKAGASANEVAPNGETPLMYASRNGNPAAIKVLLDAKADVNAKEKLRGTTPLMWAADQAHPEAVKLLAAAGADVAATSNNDTKGNRAYLAPSVAARSKSAQGAGGAGNQGKAGALDPADQAKGKQQGKNKGGGGGFAGGGGGAGKGKQGKQVNAAAITAAGGVAGLDADTLQQIADALGVEVAALTAPGFDLVGLLDQAASNFSFGRTRDQDGGGLTALVFSARQNCIECARALLDAGANVNQTTHYGWTPLLTATQNRNYKLATFLMERGANPNLKNNGGWSPLYLATDNRNIEVGDYPTPKADMDHMEYIKLLVAKGADVNVRVCGTTSTPDNCRGDSTETRTNFTMQWLNEDGATPFLRAAQSSDVPLMKFLLEHGADPKLNTAYNVSPLAVASGIAWVEGVTYEHSPAENLEVVKMLLDLGLDPNIQDNDGRAALHGAAHKGRNEVVQLLVDRGAKLDLHDYGSRDTVNGDMKGMTWLPLNYAQGLVRVGVQSAKAHPETATFMKDLMAKKGLEIPPDITSSICLTKGVKGCQ